jgi:pantoate--beta-alanine ligase
MIKISSIKEMQSLSGKLRGEGKIIGFVPTMGYFHEGHLSLMKKSREKDDIVVVSIFVNPTQFGPNEDFNRYPRDLEGDLKKAEEVGVDIVFTPTKDEMYPEGYRTYIEVEELSSKLCGAFRPGHFRGVATVVAKLFLIIKPHRAYFGKKDFQQLKIIERLVKDLNFEVEIVPMPIIRERDGLAMSSRNVYLSNEERKSALSLSKALQLAKSLIEKGERNPLRIERKMREFILSHPHVKKIDYVALVDPETFYPVEKVEKGTLIALAVWVGKARLIDNWEVTL